MITFEERPLETAIKQPPPLPIIMPAKSKILALVGRRYSGKSTLADMLLAFDPRFVKRSFATVLKSEFAASSGVDLKKLNTPGVKDMYRPALFEYEKKAKANNPFYFAEKLFAQRSADEFTVIDDLRFIEELQLCIQKGAVIYKVHAEAHQRRQRGWVKGEIDEHYSETELDLPGYLFWQVSGHRGGTIFNTRSDKDDPDRNYLRGQVIQVMKQHFPVDL